MVKYTDASVVIYHLRSADMMAKHNKITVVYREVTKLNKGAVVILRLMMYSSTGSHSAV